MRTQVAPWISLVLMITAGIGLVLRHDLLPVLGFDLGIASAALAIAGVLVFSGRREPVERDEETTLLQWRQPLVAVSLSIVVFGAYTLFGALLTPLSETTAQVPVAPGGTAQRPAKGRVAMLLRRQADGLFTAPAQINGSPMRLVVDSGAATIVLSAEDARRAGVNIAALNFTVPLKTAGGVVYTAPTQLERVFIGPLAASDVAALVAKPSRLEFSILGMSFLKRLRSYEIRGDHLALES